MKPSFGYVFILSLLMSFVVGAVMTVAMFLYNGQPLEAGPVALSVLIATVVGLVVMLVLPVARGGEVFAGFYGAAPSTLAFGLLQSVVIATVMTFCVSFAMTAFSTGFATFPDGTTFLVRWLTPIAAVWGISYMATILALPPSTALACKVAGSPGSPHAVADEVAQP